MLFKYKQKYGMLYAQSYEYYIKTYDNICNDYAPNNIDEYLMDIYCLLYI